MKKQLAALVFTLAVGAAAVAPAAAQVDYDGPHRVPIYTGWQSGWDRYEFDRGHVILGVVAGFEPFRLQVARRDGVVQMIDLKQGTIILPTGATPAENQRVAIVGYYSRGTFIANRVILRS